MLGNILEGVSANNSSIREFKGTVGDGKKYRSWSCQWPFKCCVPCNLKPKKKALVFIYFLYRNLCQGDTSRLRPFVVRGNASRFARSRRTRVTMQRSI